MQELREDELEEKKMDFLRQAKKIWIVYTDKRKIERILVIKSQVRASLRRVETKEAKGKGKEK